MRDCLSSSAAATVTAVPSGEHAYEYDQCESSSKSSQLLACTAVHSRACPEDAMPWISRCREVVVCCVVDVDGSAQAAREPRLEAAAPEKPVAGGDALEMR